MKITCIKSYLSKLFAMLIFGSATLLAYADLPGYITDHYGTVVKSSTGDCLQSSTWSPDLAVAECDRTHTSKRLAAAPSPSHDPVGPASNIQSTPTLSNIDKIILAEDTLFEYNKSIIKPSGKETLNNIVGGLTGKNEVIISTDLSRSNNIDPDLVLRRTAALKTYLVASGIDGDRIYIQERDEQSFHSPTLNTEPGTKRVEIEIVPAPQPGTSPPK